MKKKNSLGNDINTDSRHRRKNHINYKLICPCVYKIVERWHPMPWHGIMAVR